MKPHESLYCLKPYCRFVREKGGDMMVIKKKQIGLSSLGMILILLGGLLYYGMVQASNPVEYDPWADMNDDGTINILDIANVALVFGTSGEAINKTALLLELQSRVEDLEKRVPKFSSVFQWADANTTSTDWVDMDGVSVTLSLNETSHILIICTLMATTVPVGNAIFMRASVGTETAIPFEYQLVGDTDTYTTFTVSYHLSSVAPGTHTVKMQWRVSAGTGWAIRLALTVVALPA